MPPSADPTTNTPLAPSVEKAYYRKCIQLKRRLNEVESANDEAKIRRVRLDRAIMKMRLERAFLLDELRKRMDHNVDGSEGSGDDGITTPPPDRPHRDKRRRQATGPSGAPSTSTFQAHAYTPSGQHTSEPGANPGEQMMHEDGMYSHGVHAQQTASVPSQPPAFPAHSPYQQPPTGMPSGPPPGMNGTSHDDDREERPISREAGATGEPIGAGPAMVEENGERKILSSAENANVESQRQDTSRGGFAAINQ